MKKTILVTVVALLMLALAATMVSAGPNPGQRHLMGNPPNFTDAQKAEMEPLMNEMNDLRGKMFEVHKAMIQKQVSFGYMTQADADACIARMEEHKDHGPGMMGMGNGSDMKRGHGMGRGHGMMNDCPMNQVPPTDQQ